MVQTVLSLRRPRMDQEGDRARTASPAERGKGGIALDTLSATPLWNDVLDAGQVGVSVVRRLGSRVPLHSAGTGRSGLREAQLMLLLREWYMHPNGQIPAYEWAFGDVNPPVHAWAAWRVYKIDKKRMRGDGDRAFLARVFQKLLLNFTWWVNRKDRAGQQRLRGRVPRARQHRRLRPQQKLPDGAILEQSDGTAGWRCSASTCWRSPGARERGSRVRGRRLQVLRALPLHRRRDEQLGVMTARPLG